MLGGGGGRGGGGGGRIKWSRERGSGCGMFITTHRPCQRSKSVPPLASSNFHCRWGLDFLFERHSWKGEAGRVTGGGTRAQRKRTRGERCVDDLISA